MRRTPRIARIVLLTAYVSYPIAFAPSSIYPAQMWADPLSMALCCLIRQCQDWVNCENQCGYNCWRDSSLCNPKAKSCWSKVPQVCGPNGSPLQGTTGCCEQIIECEQTQLVECHQQCGQMPPGCALLLASNTVGFPIQGTLSQRIAAGQKLCCHDMIWSISVCK